MTEENENKTLAKYIRSEGMIKRFEYAVGEARADSFISSVLLLVKNTETLHDCTYESIVTAALRAGALRLSVDPAKNQAYLVPFKNYKKGIEEATLIVSYKGLYDMAIRTREYISIHDHLVPAGKIVELDPFTGLPTIIDDPESPGGWSWTLIMVSGFRKTLYMSFDEIHAHKEKYSKGWQNPKSTWSKYPEAMEKKTPLRILLTQFGYFGDDRAADLIKAIESNQEDEVIDGLIIEPEQKESGPVYEDIKSDIDAENKGRKWSAGAIALLIKDEIFLDEDFARGALSLCCIENENHINDVTKWGRDFMGLIDDEYPAKKAADIANNRYLTTQREKRAQEQAKEKAPEPKEWTEETLTELVEAKIFPDKDIAKMSLDLSITTLTPSSDYKYIKAWALDFKEARKEFSPDIAKNVANNKHKRRVTQLEN